jgi:hypothetical protein
MSLIVSRLQRAFLSLGALDRRTERPRGSDSDSLLLRALFF